MAFNEKFESTFDRLYRILIPQGSIDVPAKISWHLGVGFTDYQNVVRDEVPRLEDHAMRGTASPPGRGRRDRHPW